LLGNLEKELCNQAWNAVIDANEMLRTTFQWEKLANPVQIVLKKYLLHPVYYDLWVNDIDNTKEKLDAIKSIDRDLLFNLHDVPFRVTICKTGENRWEMIISYHHILFDGWSSGVILAEFFNAYHALARGNEWPKPVKTGFKEFIKRFYSPSAGTDISAQKYFWENYLAGIETPTVLSFKNEDAGKRGPGIRKGNFSVSFADDEKKALENFCMNYKITPASLFYGAWGILLQKYNNRDDVIFGTTTSGRPGEIPGIVKMVGLFINTIPLRISLNDNVPISALLSGINDSLTGREKYEHTSLVDIREFSQISSQEELFDSIVIIENYPLDSPLTAENDYLKVTAYSLQERPHYDLSVLVKLFATIEVNFIFNRDLLADETVYRLTHHFKTLILRIIDNPDQKACEIDFLTVPEKKQLLFDFNNTVTDYSPDKSVHELFAEQATKTGDWVALSFQGAFLKNRPLDPQKTFIFLTYRELDVRSNQLAYLLTRENAGYDSIIGIMMDRSPEMLIGIWGILKSGAAYLPIDPSFPPERIDFMLRDCQAKLIIKEIAEQMSGSLTSSLPRFHFSDSSNLAYLIYTSGSTGKPKGVMIEHRNLVNFFQGMTQRIGFLPGKTILAVTTIS
ncbi:MAG TPA: condensation domain-containing protein, partial [Candidatus Kapabacteria bacterium]|nr:condensation domain-containing protein [Candidatus Kapabacteria bacterium]